MKEIKMGNGRTITTPWLRREEAAKYCGISQSMFDSHSRDLPHGGDNRIRLYDVRVLDKWMNNEIPECPFDLPKKKRNTSAAAKAMADRKTRTVLKEDEDMTLVHPGNGKVYKVKD